MAQKLWPNAGRLDRDSSCGAIAIAIESPRGGQARVIEQLQAEVAGLRDELRAQASGDWPGGRWGGGGGGVRILELA